MADDTALTGGQSVQETEPEAERSTHLTVKAKGLLAEAIGDENTTAERVAAAATSLDNTIQRKSELRGQNSRAQIQNIKNETSRMSLNDNPFCQTYHQGLTY